jgi:hypothetical protein
MKDHDVQDNRQCQQTEGIEFPRRYSPKTPRWPRLKPQKMQPKCNQPRCKSEIALSVSVLAICDMKDMHLAAGEVDCVQNSIFTRIETQGISAFQFDRVLRAWIHFQVGQSRFDLPCMLRRYFIQEFDGVAVNFYGEECQC